MRYMRSIPTLLLVVLQVFGKSAPVATDEAAEALKADSAWIHGDTSVVAHSHPKLLISERIAHGNVEPKVEVTNEDLAQGDMNDSDFCMPMMPMTMFMDGFHSSLHKNKNKKGMMCLSYFFGSWQLTDRGKFVGAMVYSFLLAFLLEAFSALRALIHGQDSMKRRRPRLHHALMSLIYGGQAFLGYLIMLATMAFSVELIVSVVFGLMFGNLVFLKYDYLYDNRRYSLRQRREDAPSLQVPLLPNPV